MLAKIKRRLRNILFGKLEFKNSTQYWNDRYNKGGNSGAGSYDKFAKFKAEIINEFVATNRVESVIELGCGDGNQLGYFKFNQYLGIDISSKAVEICQTKFKHDASKTFKLESDFTTEKAQLTVSLDVIYHLIEDAVFEQYMQRLFASTTQYVIIYSSNQTENEGLENTHVKHRKFTQWISENKPDFQQLAFIKNKYPYNNNSKESSFADFYIFEKKS